MGCDKVVCACVVHDEPGERGCNRTLSSFNDQANQGRIPMVDHVNTLTAGHRLNEYEVLRASITGGAGMTYLAFDHHLLPVGPGTVKSSKDERDEGS